MYVQVAAARLSCCKYSCPVDHAPAALSCQPAEYCNQQCAGQCLVTTPSTRCCQQRAGQCALLLHHPLAIVSVLYTSGMLACQSAKPGLELYQLSQLLAERLEGAAASVLGCCQWLFPIVAFSHAFELVVRYHHNLLHDLRTYQAVRPRF